MMERPCFSNSLARAKTASAPSPVSSDMRDASRAMVESRILSFVEPFVSRLGADKEVGGELWSAGVAHVALARVSRRLTPARGQGSMGSGRIRCCNPQGQAAVLVVWAVPEGGSS